MGKTFKDGFSKGRNFKNKDKHYTGAFKKKKPKHTKLKQEDYRTDIP